MTFIAYFGETCSGEWGPSKSVEIVGAVPEFAPDSGDTATSEHLVRVQFEAAVAARMCPSFGDMETIDPALYRPPSGPAHFRPGEPMDEYLSRFHRIWMETGICPSPRMYEVQPVSWRLSSSFAEDPSSLGFRQYLIEGHDSYVEVLAKGWRWERGIAVH